MKKDLVVGTDYIICQDNNNFKYTTDSLILSSFSKVKGDCADLGSGTGILSFRKIDKCNTFTNVEINKEAFKILEINTKLNKLEDKIKNYNIDVSDVGKYLKKQSMDRILINPPYFSKSTKSENENYKMARHSDTLNSFIEAASYLLKNGGKIYIVIPTIRLVDLFCLLRSENIEPKRLRFIKKDIFSNSKIALVEGVKQGSSNLIVEKDFILYENGEYTEGLNSVYKNEEI